MRSYHSRCRMLGAQPGAAEIDRMTPIESPRRWMSNGSPAALVSFAVPHAWCTARRRGDRSHDPDRKSSTVDVQPKRINRETRDRDSVGAPAQRNIQPKRINRETRDRDSVGAPAQRNIQPKRINRETRDRNRARAPAQRNIQPKLLTSHIHKACDLLHIHFADHVILTDGGYFSYREVQVGKMIC